MNYPTMSMQRTYTHVNEKKKEKVSISCSTHYCKGYLKTIVCLDLTKLNR